jgi:dTDP-4-amino-4,6-dideoxygalactose transaminase
MCTKTVTKLISLLPKCILQYMIYATSTFRYADQTFPNRMWLPVHEALGRMELNGVVTIVKRFLSIQGNVSVMLITKHENTDPQ